MKTAKEIHDIMQLPVLRAAFDDITDKFNYSDNAAALFDMFDKNDDLCKAIHNAILAEQEQMFYYGMRAGAQMVLALDLTAISVITGGVTNDE